MILIKAKKKQKNQKLQKYEVDLRKIIKEKLKAA